jgi:hypothetical protein
MSVWPVAIQTLTPLGIGIIATSEAQAPAAVPRHPHPGQRERDSRR